MISSEKRRSVFEIEVENTEFIYDGMAKEPGASVKGLMYGRDYEVSYSNNIKAGNAAAIMIQGIGNYTGSVTRTFSILAPSGSQSGDGSGNSFDDSGSGGSNSSNGTQNGTDYAAGSKTGSDNSAQMGEDSDSKGVDNNISYGSDKNPDNNLYNGFDMNISFGPKKGSMIKDKKYNYKVIKRAAANRSGELQVTGLKKKSLKNIKILSVVTIGGFRYKITSIGKNAFKKNKKISGVKTGKFVQTIGVSSFEGCSKLKQVTIDSVSLTTIGKKAFKSDKNLKKLIIRSSKLKKAGKQMLKGTSPKLTVKVPKKKKKAYKKLIKKAGNKKAKVK